MTMEKLSEKEWKPFQIDDEFDIKSGVRLESRNRTPGERPFIGALDNSNGVTQFVSNENASLDSNFLGVNYNGNGMGIGFYHPYKCVCTDDVKRFHLKHVTDSEELALFDKTVIEKQRGKFGYLYKFNAKRMAKTYIFLPVDDSGEPDYDYMAQYTSEMRKSMLMRYRNYAAGQLSKLEYKDVPALDEKEWKPIAIASIFSLVRGRESNMAMLEDGDVPLISAKNSSNGLKGFVDTPNKLIHGGCITLNNDGDGGAGLAYYQPANMALDTHVTALIPKFEMSNWAMLFIAECISGLHGFFGHGLSISNTRAKNVRVMLPMDDDGEPDYAYMEQYAKNMMLRKYKQFLQFLDRSEEKAK